MKDKKYYLAGGLIIAILGFVFYKKRQVKIKLDNSITNGDKVTATSLSDAENKTSKQTTPVNIEEARKLGVAIADFIVKKNRYKTSGSKNAVQKEIDRDTLKLFEMGYVALPNGAIEKL